MATKEKLNNLLTQYLEMGGNMEDVANALEDMISMKLRSTRSRRDDALLLLDKLYSGGNEGSIIYDLSSMNPNDVPFDLVDELINRGQLNDERAYEPLYFSLMDRAENGDGNAQRQLNKLVRAYPFLTYLGQDY